MKSKKNAALEYYERNEVEIKEYINNMIYSSQNEYFGYFYHLELSKVNSDYIYGACYVLNTDDVETRNAKNNRMRFANIGHYIDNLKPNEFEQFCGKFISLIGVESPIVSRSSGDQGIDFFGRWDLRSIFSKLGLPSGVERQFQVWIIGQAKKYSTTKVGTEVVRELVGSIELAKAKAFSEEVDEYRNLEIAYCNPVFYCLIITGAITSGTAKLLGKAGVVFFDRDLLSVFIADNIDKTQYTFEDEGDFKKWMAQ